MERVRFVVCWGGMNGNSEAEKDIDGGWDLYGGV